MISWRIIHLLVKETSDKYKMKGSRYQKWNKSTLKKRIIIIIKDFDFCVKSAFGKVEESGNNYA